jgi:serine/threonine-protein kinase PknG
VLSFDFTGFTSTYAERLPEPAGVPLLAEQESYYRWLARATHPDPRRRFGSAHDMAEQLHGVLREVLSAADGVPRPAPSTLFTPERRAFGTGAGDAAGSAVTLPQHLAAAPPRPPTEVMPVAGAVIAALPLPTVDPADPAASHLATIGMLDPESLMAALAVVPVRSTEVRLRLVRAHLEHGDLDSARTELDALASYDPYDWRTDWYGALVALAAGELSNARDGFQAVYQAVPGEPAAQLALALAAELTGDKEAAGTCYERVWRTDRGFVSAAFGLARIRFGHADRDAAVAVLDQVPESSTYHLAAQVAAVRARLGAAPTALAETDLLDASTRLERMELDLERQARLSVETIHKALQWVLAARQPAAGRVLGHELTERELRFGLERSYRTLAKLSPDRRTRAALVDQANQVRPRTLV